jgi:transposase
MRFSVSVGWAKKVSRALLHTGQMERPPGAKRGPVSKLTEEVRKSLRSWIAAQADLTLAELRLRLRQECELSVSVGRLWAVLRELDLRLKKSHSTPPSRTPKRAAENARNGGSRWSGSKPSA